MDLTDKDIKTADEIINKYGEAGSPFEVTKDGETYQGREVAVKSEPLIDSGTGKKLYLRNFVFHKNPAYKDRKLTNQEIFNLHWREMERFMWGDGLIPYKEIEARVTHTGNRYVISIVCEPRLGISSFDTAYTLQQFLPPKSLQKKK